jgi:uncharacterized protein (TIGR02246 family)
MMTRTTAIVGLAALVLAGAAHAGAPDKATIQALDDQFDAAVRAGDAAALSMLYAEDATLMPAGAPRMDGRSAIKAYWGAGMAQIGDAALTADDVKLLGPDYVREVGHYALKTKGPPSMTISGKYIVIWKREGGTWKLWTDIWNGDSPPGG